MAWTSEKALSLIREVGLVPIVRAPSAEDAIRAAEAIVAAGIGIAEITMTVPRALKVMEAVADADLDAAVDGMAERMALLPKNQLMMQKMMINQAYENMGLATTQMFATLFDGIARHTPEGVGFKRRCEEVGFQQAVRERDGKSEG